jgi:outer membrane protein OmpA-like peptidoglycan-associated protein
MEKKQFQPLMLTHKRLAWSGVKSVAESASSGVTSDGEASLQTSNRHRPAHPKPVWYTNIMSTLSWRDTTMVGQTIREGEPSMAKQRVTKSLAAAAIIGLFAAHAATAQQTPSLPLPAGSTAHFVYFATGNYALTPEDQDHIRDVAGMMQSTPAFVATIIGKTDSVGSAEFNEHLAQRRAEAVFEALVYTHKVPENRVRLHWTGERLPYISTADEQAESQNRMVAIIVSNDPSRCQ